MDLYFSIDCAAKSSGQAMGRQGKRFGKALQAGPEDFVKESAGVVRRKDGELSSTQVRLMFRGEDEDG
ncbi:hypothetical protein V1L54_13270 [Streptomyces sp. TRM 70361]|uniref:hypothetical protein n=1 Tax=Streptomyces sp. TRM 70361 TaxID=3116553 RepID=UPI002E7B947A|nr:hypothetical protein [Streptomyces sp. TRM 70361]MEE1940362.1 hypothetical protein [Streptomyces sp. TRM 70361]